MLIIAGVALIVIYVRQPVQAAQVPAPFPSMSLLIQGKPATIPGRIPANGLLASGIHLFPGDQLLDQGLAVNPYATLSSSESLLQYVPGIPITLAEDGYTRTFNSSAPNLGMALWQAGVKLDPEDTISPSLDTPLSKPIQVTLRRARKLTIQVGSQQVQLRSSAMTVGAALADAGLSLQGLDYTQPAESAPVPSSGVIRLVRVQEKVQLENQIIPYKTQYQSDPDTELDQKRVIQAGETGLIVSRIRIRLEDGKEISRQKEAEWTARQPKDALVGYGTKVVLHTEVVDGVTITYWRKISAYATSYAPCEIYPDHCSYETASGMTLQKGVVAVIRSWYYQLKGVQVYVPGYGQGTIADIGGGVGGQNWIDLGYSDSDYVGWHSVVPVYFLAPAPANISWALP